MASLVSDTPPPAIYKNPNGMPTCEGKNLHMEIGAGDLANRVVTVGSLQRAEKIALNLDSCPEPRKFTSGRGFTTITGTYKGTPVSIVSIGMGPSMMDFFVRESRLICDGPMAMIRFGTCGGISPQSLPGCIVVASEGSGYVSRNFNSFPRQPGDDASTKSCYSMARLVPSDATASALLVQELRKVMSADCVVEGANVTAESFYSSQGRVDENFDDNNAHVIDAIVAEYPSAKSLEMESFMLLHLAACSKAPIHATAAAIVIANRHSSKVVDGATVDHLEEAGGRAVLEAIIAIPL